MGVKEKQVIFCKKFSINQGGILRRICILENVENFSNGLGLKKKKILFVCFQDEVNYLDKVLLFVSREEFY